MDAQNTQRQHIIEAINTLPEELVTEIANFIDYLSYKSKKQQTINSSGAAFLLSIAKLGNSLESNVSERDEEILANEVNPTRGWSLNLNEQA